MFENCRCWLRQGTSHFTGRKKKTQLRSRNNALHVAGFALGLRGRQPRNGSSSRESRLAPKATARTGELPCPGIPAERPQLMAHPPIKADSVTLMANRLSAVKVVAPEFRSTKHPQHDLLRYAGASHVFHRRRSPFCSQDPDGVADGNRHGRGMASVGSAHVQIVMFGYLRFTIRRPGLSIC